MGGENGKKAPLKEAMRLAGAKKIREACVEFVKELKHNVNQVARRGLHRALFIDRYLGSELIWSAHLPNEERADLEGAAFA